MYFSPGSPNNLDSVINTEKSIKLENQQFTTLNEIIDSSKDY